MWRLFGNVAEANRGKARSERTEGIVSGRWNQRRLALLYASGYDRPVRSVVRGLVLISVVAGMTAFLAASSLGAGQVATNATVFEAFTPSGAPAIPVWSKAGYCWTGSLTINRSDAWRCFVGNYIYDPCFSSPHDSGVVICPDRQLNSGISIRLTRALPQQYADPGAPSMSNQPWNVQLASGRHCVLSSGASNVIHGVRLNYFCGRTVHFGLWGFPNRRTEPWTIRIAPFTATSLHRRRAIRHAWM